MLIQGATTKQISILLMYCLMIIMIRNCYTFFSLHFSCRWTWFSMIFLNSTAMSTSILVSWYCKLKFDPLLRNMHLVLHDGSGLRLGKVLNISCLYVYTEVIPFHCHPPSPLSPPPKKVKGITNWLQWNKGMYLEVSLIITEYYNLYNPQ